MLKIALVEDNEKYVDLLQQYIQRCSQLTAETFTTVCFSNGLDFIDGYTSEYDIIFMDINMPFCDGLKAAQRIRDIGSEVPIIFVTNLAQYAIKAYEVNALDYILKPVQFPDFFLKLNKAIKIVNSRKDNQLMIRQKDVIKLISIRNLCYIEVQNHILYYHTIDEVYEASGQLKALEDNPNLAYFAKCNNYCLVNPRYVTEIGNSYVIVNGEEIALSRRRKTEFNKQLAKYI